MATSDRANRTRLIVMAFGIALCAFALLAVATVNPLLNSVTARSYASSPGVVVGTGPAFFAQRISNPVDSGTVVTGTLLVGPADAAPPPGTDRFPQPGEVLVSPALATALADPANGDLRALITGTIVGQIDPDVLVAPREWTYYQGVASLPADTQPTTGWGAYGDSRQDTTVADVNPQLWAILLTGVAVLMIPLLLFVGMASRIGAAHRDRRSATLRLLGASQRQLRWIVVAEVGLASLAGLALAAVGYLAVRLLAPFVTVGGFGAQTEDIRPGLTATILIAVGVPLLAALSALTGSRRAAVAPLGPQARPVSRPAVWWRFLLVAVTAVAIPYVLHEINVRIFDVGATVLLCGLVVLTVLCVAALVGPATHAAAAAVDLGAPAAQLARGRILRYPGLSTRPAAAVATVLASVIALMSVLSLRPDIDPATGDSLPRPYFGEVKDLSLADFRRLDTDLHTVSGATSVVVMGQLPLSSSSRATAFVATCDQIRQLTDTGTGCSDGDSFGQIQTPVGGPGDLFTVNESSATWTTPAGSRNTYVDVDPAYASNSYLLTPSVAAQIPDLGPIPRVQVSVLLAPGSLSAAREALTWLGPQSATVLTYSDFRGGVSDTYSWVRTVLLASAAFVLLICALAQWLLAAEYVTERRRSFALARASGVPLAVLTRSVLIGALFPVAIGALVAAGFGAVLAWTITTGRGGVFTLDTKWLVISCTTTLFVSLMVAIGSAFQLRRATRPTSLRTE